MLTLGVPGYGNAFPDLLSSIHEGCAKIENHQYNIIKDFLSEDNTTINLRVQEVMDIIKLKKHDKIN